jgi:K+-transporting ATPase ATPase A chain
MVNNPGYHGFSEMLYENTLVYLGWFEGLGDNNLWWNISTGFVLILGRFLPIIAVAMQVCWHQKYILQVRVR